MRRPPLDTSHGENIQDSAIDFNMQLPSAFRGSLKVLDNQQSMSILEEDGGAPALANGTKDIKGEGTRRDGTDKQTTVKKLTDNQNGLYAKCTSILSEVN